MTTTPVRRCQVHLVHRPTPRELHQHHVWPLAMGGPDEPGNLVTVCPTGHANIHKALRAIIDGLRPAGGRAELRLARLAYDRWTTAGRPGKPL